MKKFFIVLMCMMTLIFNTFAQDLELKMVKVPGANFEMLEHEVTLGLYVSVMGEQPENLEKANNNLAKGILGSFGIRVKDEKKYYYQEIGIHDNHPVVAVSFYDAIYFCNKLSALKGLIPVYSVEGQTDVDEWEYEPHLGKCLIGTVSVDENADGYRLPSVKEWLYVTRTLENHTYPGSDDIEEVAWYKKNSNKTTHEIEQKNANSFGLYDLAGNVDELLFSPVQHERDAKSMSHLCECKNSLASGGHYNSPEFSIKLSNDYKVIFPSCQREETRGFRIVRTVE